ncbi:MAG TPA: hypothetical protein VMX76_02195 [Nevskiaceae bacterium]|nr:hypothetical protein [Nevskiaceae bacterium]
MSAERRKPIGITRRKLFLGFFGSAALAACRRVGEKVEKVIETVVPTETPKLPTLIPKEVVEPTEKPHPTEVKPEAIATPTAVAFDVTPEVEAEFKKRNGEPEVAFSIRVGLLDIWPKEMAEKVGGFEGFEVNPQTTPLKVGENIRVLVDSEGGKARFSLISWYPEEEKEAILAGFASLLPQKLNGREIDYLTSQKRGEQEELLHLAAYQNTLVIPFITPGTIDQENWDKAMTLHAAGAVKDIITAIEGEGEKEKAVVVFLNHQGEELLRVDLKAVNLGEKETIRLDIDRGQYIFFDETGQEIPEKTIKLWEIPEKPEPLVEFYRGHIDKFTGPYDVAGVPFQGPIRIKLNIEKIPEGGGVAITLGKNCITQKEIHIIQTGFDQGGPMVATMSMENPESGWTNSRRYGEAQISVGPTTLEVVIEGGTVNSFLNGSLVDSFRERFDLSTGGVRFWTWGEKPMEGVDLSILVSQEVLESIPTPLPAPTKEPIPENREDLINWWADSVPLENFTAEEKERFRRVMREWLPRIPVQMEIPPEAVGFKPICEYGDVARNVRYILKVKKDPELEAKYGFGAALGDDRIMLISSGRLSKSDCSLVGVAVNEARAAELIAKGMGPFKRGSIEAEGYLAGYFVFESLRNNPECDQSDVDWWAGYYLERFKYWFSQL